MKHFPLIWASLWRKKTRTILTLLSIIVAFLLFGLLQGVNSAFSRGVDLANVDRLIVINKVSLTESLPSSYLSQIEAAPGVAGVAYATWFGGYYQESKNFIFAVPVDIDRYLDVVREIRISPETLEAFKINRTGAIVGTEAMKKWGWTVGDRVPITTQIWTKTDGSMTYEFDIVGTYEDTLDASQTNGLFFHNEYFDESRAFAQGTVGWYLLRVEDPTQAAQVAAGIDQLFANSSNETKTQSEKEFTMSFLKQLGDINFIVTSIIGAVFFTLLFLTGNTMMQAVRERIPELAVLKTLGYSDTQVLGFVISEALILCLLAAGIGLGLAWLAFPAMEEFVGTTRMDPKVVATGLGAAALLAVVIGLLPGLRALRLNIVDALAGR